MTVIIFYSQKVICKYNEDYSNYTKSVQIYYRVFLSVISILSSKKRLCSGHAWFSINFRTVPQEMIRFWQNH